MRFTRILLAFVMTSSLAAATTDKPADKGQATSVASTKAKAFELYPASNDAQPTTYTKTAPAFQEDGKPWKFAHGAKVQVKVDASQVLRNINPYQFGNNVAWWDSKDWLLDPDRIEKAKQAGIKFWRWPGGSASDVYHWDGKYDRPPKSEKDPAHMNALWAVNTDNFIEFCQKTGSEAIVTVNYGAARYADVNYAADMAARWVKYFNVEKKFKVRYWEIGNEVYGNWEEGNKIDGKPQLTGDVYGKDLRVIAEAMRKVDPEIYIGAVAVDADDGGDWSGYRWWMRDLLPQLQGKVDYLILHQYFEWPFKGDVYTNPGPAELLGNLHKVSEAKVAVDQMVEKYAPSEKGIPVVLTEFNLLNASSEPTIQLVNGLYMAEVIGDAAKSGYVCSNYWDWKNGLDAKLHGDHAMLASNDNSIPDATPRPSFYSYALYSRAFGDKMIAADSSESSVKVYASRFSSGEVGLVVVNENPQNKTLVFDLSGFKPQGKLMGWVLTGKDLNDPQVSWNGEAGPMGGGGPFPIDTIAPYRGTFKTDKPLQLPIQAKSVTGLILY
ncbi:MAG TPA: hypothetical protein VMV05_10780 [bacterium]|nr:hypothetical protein [bacterium]